MVGIDKAGNKYFQNDNYFFGKLWYADAGQCIHITTHCLFVVCEGGNKLYLCVQGLNVLWFFRLPFSRYYWSRGFILIGQINDRIIYIYIVNINNRVIISLNINFPIYSKHHALITPSCYGTYWIQLMQNDCDDCSKMSVIAFIWKHNPSVQI